MDEQRFRSDAATILTGMLSNGKLIMSLEDFDGKGGETLEFNLVRKACWLAKKLSKQCDYTLAEKPKKKVEEDE